MCFAGPQLIRRIFYAETHAPCQPGALGDPTGTFPVPRFAAVESEFMRDWDALYNKPFWTGMHFFDMDIGRAR
jgi:hypothetical protein